MKFHGHCEKTKSENPVIVFIEELIYLLGDIDRLANIRKEIGDISDIKILEEFEDYANKG
jgi:hypothetical protein